MHAGRVGAVRRGESSEFLERPRVGKQFAEDAPGVLGGAVHGGDRPAAQQVERRQEVVRTSAVLEARDELQQDAVDAVAEARLGPVRVQRMLQSINRSVVFNSDNDAHNKHTHTRYKR